MPFNWVASGRKRVKGSCGFKAPRLATNLKGVIVSEITNKKPVELFDYTDLEKSYKDLIKKHHPDVGGTQADFIHIAQCYEIAKKEKEEGYRIGSKCISFYSPLTIKDLDIDYRSVHEFSYGKVYDGSSHLIYEFPENAMDSELPRIHDKVKFRPLSNTDIEEKVRIHLPSEHRTSAWKLTDRAFVAFEKTGPSMLLADVIPHNIPKVGHVVFEGAQGLALDQFYGRYPYVTRSNTGMRNVLEMQRKEQGKFSIDEIIYVSRTYETRHGNDPNFVLGELTLEGASDKTNVKNEWQGELRYRKLTYRDLFDRIKLDLQANNLWAAQKTSDIVRLAFTHLDQILVDEFDLRYFKDKINNYVPLGYTVNGETRNAVDDKIEAKETKGV